MAPAAAVAIIGNSFTAGTPLGGQGPDGWPALVTAKLRQRGLDIAPSVGAEVGSGYVTPGITGDIFADQIRAVVRPSDRLVIVFGSGNDTDVPTQQLQRALHQTFDAIWQAAPTTKLIVIGPVWPHPDPPPNVLVVRDVVKTEADSTGATFVDPIADGWLMDDSSLIASDGVSPTDAGHAFMADKIAPLIAQQLGAP